jgi:GT2 family glycosyltransferase
MTNDVKTRFKALPDISILIVSFNTCAVLRECMESIVAAKSSLSLEVIVIDNNSRDDSVAMVEREFPWAKIVRSDTNLGFGNANNKALEVATGRYIVLLNSDAFLQPDSLSLSISKMEANPGVGLAGGRLVGRDGALQPSARLFPSLLRQLIVMSGLSTRFPKSRFFGQADRTWADPMVDAAVDWVPGAYSIIRRDVLDKMPLFDSEFFLYYEEVDLCYRIRKAGYLVMYWPEIVVTHIGGESSRQVKTLEMSSTGAQLVLWRMRSTLLYYRKHMSLRTQAIRWLEVFWYRLRALRNRLRNSEEAAALARNQIRLAEMMQQAWRETNGGRVSPPQPW